MTMLAVTDVVAGYGAHDEVLSPDRIARVAARIPGLVGIVTYPDGWHWLFRDRQAPRVWDDVADFALSAARRSGEGRAKGP